MTDEATPMASAIFSRSGPEIILCARIRSPNHLLPCDRIH